MVTTHSPNFIDLSDLEGLVLVRKQGPETRTTQLTREQLADFCRETGATKAQPDSILDHYAAAATGEILAGFFARKLVLVEGPTEALALPIYFSRLGLEVAKEGIAVLPVHGVSNLAKWWRLFSAYNLPVYVLFDNDTSDDEDGGKRRDVLSALGVSRDAQEQLIRSDEWVIDKRFGIFGSSLEEALRSGLGEQHDELSRDARQYGLGPTAGKPLVARFIAERIDLDEERQGVQKLRTLIQAIKNSE